MFSVRYTNHNDSGVTIRYKCGGQFNFIYATFYVLSTALMIILSINNNHNDVHKTIYSSFYQWGLKAATDCQIFVIISLLVSRNNNILFICLRKFEQSLKYFC